MRNTVSELQGYFCPFGYLDVQAMCELGDELELSEYQLFEIIDDARESMGYENWAGIDPVYCVFDFIVQNARNVIDEVTGYDFINDFTRNGTEIYAYGNYMCSSIDYSDEAVEELVSKIS